MAPVGLAGQVHAGQGACSTWCCCHCMLIPAQLLPVPLQADLLTNYLVGAEAYMLAQQKGRGASSRPSPACGTLLQPRVSILLCLGLGLSCAPPKPGLGGGERGLCVCGGGGGWGA
jgi:hypothetical protein